MIHSYSTIEEASKQAHYLRDNIEPHISVCVAEVGKWIPLDDDEKYSNDVQYKEQQLNDLMKMHKDNLEKSKNFLNEKAKTQTNKTIDSNNENFESTFDKINKLKQKLKPVSENEKSKLEEVRNLCDNFSKKEMNIN